MQKSSRSEPQISALTFFIQELIIMKLKALRNIVLPDSREVKAGDIFEYKGDLKPLDGIVEVMPVEKPKKAKKKEEANAE